MQVLIMVYLGVLGMIFGSFSLAMVDRMKAKKDWVRGRSACDSCKTTLKAVDLIPIVSWLSTHGRCRYCKKKLPASYPLVELALGVAFVISYVFYPLELSGVNLALFIVWLAALVLLMALIVFDLRWYLLPTKIVYALVPLGVVHWCLYASMSDKQLAYDFLYLGLALLIGSGLFFLIHTISDGKWIGDGDVRLAVVMGLFLGHPLLMWIALFIASLSGLLPAIPRVLRQKNIKQMKIPYGPFLIFGLVIAYLFGQRLIDWYTQSFIYF